MVDLTESHYSTGTATVEAGGTAVTGQGTNWAGAIRPGDLFGTHVGLPIRILSVDSNTSLTLAHEWPGAAQTASAYEIQLTPYDVGYRKAIEDLVTGIAEGNLPMFAALVGAANKLPYFDSSDSMALADFPAWARSMLSQPGSADKIPYLTGANGAALTTLTALARTFLAAANEADARSVINVALRQSNAFDDGAGRGLIVGAFGLGAHSLPTASALDNITAGNTLFRWGNTTANRPSTYGVGIQFERSEGFIQQLGVTVDGGNVTREFNRGTTGTPWTPPIPSSVYQRSNILGSVAQSGGIPTGAIIERGSNSNGSYVRYADGTQLCWHSINAGVADTAHGQVFITSNNSWTFPVQFSSVPMIVSGSNRSGSANGVTWPGSTTQSISVSSTNGLFGVSSMTGAGVYLHVLAIGRWF